MRPNWVAVAATLVIGVAVGSLWSRNRDGGDLSPINPVVQNRETTESGEILRGTPETYRARDVLSAQATATYRFDVWQESVCDGIALFYLPFAEGEDVSWYWFDPQTEQLTQQVTLSEIVQALTPHIKGFERETPNFMIGQLSTREGRPLYPIGSIYAGPTVQIGFSPNRCSAIPDIVQLMDTTGPSPVDVDLPAAIKQIRERNEASNSQL